MCFITTRKIFGFYISVVHSFQTERPKRGLGQCDTKLNPHNFVCMWYVCRCVCMWYVIILQDHRYLEPRSSVYRPFTCQANPLTLLSFSQRSVYIALVLTRFFRSDRDPSGSESFFFSPSFCSTTTEKKPSGETSKRSESGWEKDTLPYVCVLLTLEKSFDFMSVWSILFRLNVLKEGWYPDTSAVLLCQLVCGSHTWSIQVK